MRNLRNLFLPW